MDQKKSFFPRNSGVDPGFGDGNITVFVVGLMYYYHNLSGIARPSLLISDLVSFFGKQKLQIILNGKIPFLQGLTKHVEAFQ
jgi:hypothetical protein